MSSFFYIEEAGAKGLLPLSPAPQIPAEPASASLRTISLDDSEHLLHNHRASVASLRLLFAFAPECRSASPPESMFTFTGIPSRCVGRSLRTVSNTAASLTQQNSLFQIGQCQGK